MVDMHSSLPHFLKIVDMRSSLPHFLLEILPLDFPATFSRFFPFSLDIFFNADHF